MSESQENARGLKALAIQFALFFVGVVCSAHFYLTGWSVLSVLLVFFAGTRLRALGNMMHECVHNTLFPSKGLNQTFGFVLSLFLWCSFRAYKKDHLSHHRHLGHPQKDRDLARIPRQWLVTPSFLEVVKAVFCLRFLRVFLRSGDWNPFDKSETRLENLLRVAFVVFFGAICAYFLMIFPFVFDEKSGEGQFFICALLSALLAFLVPYQVLKYLSDLYDHGGLQEEEHLLDRSRHHPFRASSFPGIAWVLNALLLPRNDGLHWEHHAWPRTPTVQLSEKAPTATTDTCSPRDPLRFSRYPHP